MTSTALVQRYPTGQQTGTEDAARLWDLRAASWAWSVVKWAGAPPEYHVYMVDAYDSFQNAREVAAWHRSLGGRL